MENILKIMKTNKHTRGFQEKTRVPCEKFGRHSNPIYLVLKPLKLENFEVSIVLCLPCTATLQNMHVNCKKSTQHKKTNEAHL